MKKGFVVAALLSLTASASQASLTYRPHLVQQLLAQQGHANTNTPGQFNLASSGQSSSFKCPNPNQIQVSYSQIGTNKASANPTAGMPPVLGKWTSYGTGPFLSSKSALIFLSLSLNKVNSTSTVNGQTTQGVLIAPTCNYLDKVSKVFVPLGPENFPAVKHYSFKLSSGGQSSKSLSTKIIASYQPQNNLQSIKSRFQSSPAASKAEQRLTNFRQSQLNQ